MKWSIGRAVEVYLGEDDKVQNIKVKTTSGGILATSNKDCCFMQLSTQKKFRSDKEHFLMGVEDGPY